jgi:uncharacterized membrane protein YeaQ/YmgE (transglycosylase-associated protein family)
MGTITSVISWLVFGLVVGAIARFLLPGRQNMGWFATALLGIVGSVVGGLASSLLFRKPEGTIDAAGWIMSIIGAIVALVIYGQVTKSRSVN